MLYEVEGKQPQLGDYCFVAPSADVMGDVVLGSNVSIWFGAVIRADNDCITIGNNTNIQDNSVLHVDPNTPLNIGNNVTVGHKVMLHGCTIGDGTLVGINAVVLNGAVIGKNCLIGANALITENMQVPDGSMVLGSPGKIIKTLDKDMQDMLFASADIYVQKAAKFNKTLKPIND